MYYGWIIAFCGFLISFVGFGIRYSYGVFLSSLEAEFEMTRIVVSAIFSVNMILGAFIAFLGGWLLDKYGPRPLGLFFGVFTTISLISTGMVSASWQLFVTYSLLLALGTGAIITALVSDVFGLNRIGTIMGITSSMWAFGAAIGPAIGGIVYDVSGDYSLAFVVGAASLLIPIILLAQLNPFQLANN